MKKKISVFCLLSFALFFSFVLSGCGSVSRPLLDYQNGLTSVSADLETGEAQYKIDIIYTETGTELEIKSPENVNGIKFIRESESVYAAAAGMKIPLSSELFSNIDPILDAFLLSPDNIASITKDESGITVYTVSGEEGAYTVFIDSEGLPSSIVYEGERTFELSGILLKNDLTT